MNVEFSKAFIKASKRLSGKMLDSLRRTIVEVKAAKGIQDISDCKKLVGYRNIYPKIRKLSQWQSQLQ